MGGTVKIGEETLFAKHAWSLAADGKPLLKTRIVGGPPLLIAHTREILEQGNPGKVSFQLNLDYQPDLYKLALLRVAYLAMFHLCGYEYILSDALSVIRGFLTEKDKPTDDLRKLILGLDQWQADKLIGESIIVFPYEENEKTTAFFVTIRIDQGKERYFAAILPTPVQTASITLPHLNRIVKLLVKKSHHNLRGVNH